MKVMMKELTERLLEVMRQIFRLFDGYTPGPRFHVRTPQFVLVRPDVRPLNRKNY